MLKRQERYRECELSAVQADDHLHAAAAKRVEAELRGFRAADKVDGGAGAAAGQFFHLFHGGRGELSTACTAPALSAACRFPGVDVGDDDLRAGEGRRDVHCVQANASGTDDQESIVIVQRRDLLDRAVDGQAGAGVGARQGLGHVAVFHQIAGVRDDDVVAVSAVPARASGFGDTQSTSRSSWQARHSPQPIHGKTMRLSPTDTPVASGPNATASPMTSWPMVKGSSRRGFRWWLVRRRRDRNSRARRVRRYGIRRMPSPSPGLPYPAVPGWGIRAFQGFAPFDDLAATHRCDLDTPSSLIGRALCRFAVAVSRPAPAR